MNEIMELSKFREMVFNNTNSFFLPMPPPMRFRDGGITTYGNRRVILRDDGTVLLYERCEYCGETGLDKRGNCSACGAVPTGKFVNRPAYVSAPEESNNVFVTFWDTLVFTITEMFGFIARMFGVA